MLTFRLSQDYTLALSLYNKGSHNLEPPYVKLRAVKISHGSPAI
ncbi:hypothetical protein XIS1_460001 [Xenorhabdus innexi]|uniref:Uncharacterized protein n=1 Tax=Xenorhabdus innexi TaxID=290109 RepID=A0A1N6MXX1_9GAMM|nr:hypothetical protein XIS1_460001 [Xenorhabdus innexi]